MCWINGFFLAGKQQIKNAANNIADMNEAIRHRGPDDAGILTHEIPEWVVGLGHVRLSIVDLSPAWHQPMSYTKENGAFSDDFQQELLAHNSDSPKVIFNGEIYNFQDIKAELEDLWYFFATKSDTEVLLASYKEWGEDCVKKFNGMRAFVIYDPEKKSIFCSRDILWEKPFYYFWDGKKFIFSSEIKGILTHDIPRAINSEAVDFYLTTGYIPAPWSIYNDIFKLPARHSLRIDLKKKVLSRRAYYDFPSYKPEFDKKKLISEWKKILEDSVKIRMFADVPVGAFLSGWLDSSSVVWEMTKFVRKDNLHTFSIGFEGKYDETPFINEVKTAFGTQHHHAYFTEEEFEKILPTISEYYDEPFGDYSNFPTMFVSQLARKEVTVALSGDGGDEIFGGYTMHQVAAQMSLIHMLPRAMRKFLHFVTPKTKNNLSTLSKLKEALRVSLLPKERFHGEIWGSTLYKPPVYQRRAEQKLAELLKVNDGNFIQSMIDFDLYYNTLADNFLTKVDRASMSVALEVRAPFLDPRFIAYAHTIPTSRKVNFRKTKILMREIIKDIVPEKIVNRGKKGFEPPIDKRILQEQYMDEIEHWVELLHQKGILSKDWNDFYTEKVMKQNNIIYNVYKIRMFLLKKWFTTYYK